MREYNISCPCCGGTHSVQVGDNVRNLRNPHKDDRGWGPFNYLGSFWRQCDEIERTCPKT